MVRRVFGKITDRNGDPIPNLTVLVMDNDPWPNPDDQMGPDATDRNGDYSVTYASRNWDWAPWFWRRKRRPDIYIIVFETSQSYCDDGEWKTDGVWRELGRSRVTSNHPIDIDLRKNLQIQSYPKENTIVHTFNLGVDMYGSVDFFFHSSFVGCGPNGERITWGQWGIGSLPTTITRCWTEDDDLPQCTEEDRRAISNAWGVFVDSDRPFNEPAWESLRVIYDISDNATNLLDDSFSKIYEDLRKDEIIDLPSMIQLMFDQIDELHKNNEIIDYVVEGLKRYCKKVITHYGKDSDVPTKN